VICCRATDTKPRWPACQTARGAQCAAHLGVDAGRVRVGNGAQDLQGQAAAPLHEVLELLTLDERAPVGQSCAAGQRGHVAGNGENCWRTNENVKLKN